MAETVDCFSKSNAFITLKDHKQNFQSNPKCLEIFLEKINNKVREI